MPLKPLTINPEDFEFADEATPPAQSDLGGFAKGLGVAAAQAPFKLAQLPAQAAELAGQAFGLQPAAAGLNIPQQKPSMQPLPGQQEKASAISKALGAATEMPKELEATNPFSKALQLTAGNWPLLILGGGHLLPKLGADIAGSLGISLAEEAGLGPIAQIGAGVLGQKGFDKLSRGIKSSYKNPAKLQQFISNLYDQERKLGSSISVNNNKIIKELDNLRHEVEKKFVNPRTFSESSKSRSLSNIDAASKLASKTNMTGSDVFEIKKLLNEVYAPANSRENKIYQQLRHIFKDELNNLSKKNPQWADAWKKADELYSIEKWQSGLGRWVDEMGNLGMLPKLLSKSLTKSALSMLAGGLKIPVKGAESAARAGKFLNSLSQTTEGKKLLWDIVADSAKESTNSLTNNINKLNKKAIQYEKENPEIADSSRRFIATSLNPDDYEFVETE